MKWLLVMLFPVGLLLGATEEKKGKAVILDIENKEGSVLKAEVLSVIRVGKRDSYLCFRHIDKDRLYVYPFSYLSPGTLTTLSGIYDHSGLIVADGVTPQQLDFLEEYLAAEPRDRLLLELREVRDKERKLSREWERLQKQTLQLQMQLTQAKDPNLRKNLASAFQNSLRARDRVGKQLALCQAEIRRMEERIALLQKMGVDIEDNPFAEL